MRCSCCDAWLTPAGRYGLCDAAMSSPPHVCLRWTMIICDEHGCQPSFMTLSDDHETAWRLDRIKGHQYEGEPH